MDLQICVLPKCCKSGLVIFTKVWVGQGLLAVGFNWRFATYLLFRLSKEDKVISRNFFSNDC